MNDHDLIRNLTNDLTPVRPLPSPLRISFGWLAIALVLVAAGLLMLPLRSDLTQRASQASFICLETGLLLASALLASAISWIGRPGRAGQKSMLVVSILWVSALVVCFSLWTGWTAFHSAPGGRDIAAGFGGARCMAAVITLSVLPGVLFFGRAKKSAPVYPGLSGGLIGLASGSLGAMAIALSCSNDDPFHLYFWHFLAPILALSGIGFLGGRKFLRW